MWPRYPLLWMFLASCLAICLAGKATAEILSELLPEGVPGYGDDPGVTVDTRLHADQMPVGVRDGPLIASPLLDQSVGYNSNALPGPYRRGSWQIVTAPSLILGTDWSRDALGALIAEQDTRVLSLPAQSRTDGTVSAGGRLDVGADQLSLAASHIARHEDRGAFDTIASDRPVAFQVDDIRASFTTARGRWRITPDLEASDWTYDPTTILGHSADQSYRDRVVLQGGVALRYEMAPLRSALFVLRMISQDYTHTQAGQLTPDSTSLQVMAGLDYNDDTVWHYRLLIGGESKHFASAAYAPQNNLIAEAGVGWSPTGLTTLNATVSRETDDAAQEGVSGLTYTSAKLTIDHEYLRNLLLRAYAGWQEANFFGGGYEAGTTVGGGLTWVLNQTMRLSFTYDQTDLHSSRLIGGALAEGYSRGLGLVTMRIGL